MAEYTVQDLQDNLNYLNETKQQIKQAIIDKEQPVSDTDTFRSYADKIRAIETGIKTDDATAVASDIISPKTAYVNGEKITGTIETELFTDISVLLNTKTLKFNNSTGTGTYYILDIFPQKNLVILQTSLSAQTSINIYKYNSDTGVIDTSKKLTITTSAASGQDPALTNISTAKFSRVPVLNDNIYNIIFTGVSNNWDVRTVGVARFNIDTLTLYSDSTYNTYVFTHPNDSWGGDPDILYNIFPSQTDANKFLYYPIGPRDQGYVQNWQRIFIVTMSGKSANFTQSDALVQGNTARYVTCSKNFDYIAINELTDHNESFFRVRTNAQISKDSGTSISFLYIDDKEFMFRSRTLYTLTADSYSSYASVSSIVTSGYTHHYGIGDLLYVFYSNGTKLYQLYYDEVSAKYTIKLITTIANTSKITYTWNLLRLMFAPHNYEDTVFYTNDGINLVMLEVDKNISGGVIKSAKFSTGTCYNPVNVDTMANQVLTGHTFISSLGVQAGTMPNRGTRIITPSTSNQAILNGYHTGSGYVKGDANLVPENIKEGVTIFNVTGASTDDATAVAADLLLNKTAYVSGEKVTGTMPNNGSLSYTPRTYNQTIPLGYTSGGTIAGDADLIRDNIVKGKNIFGVEGAYNSAQYKLYQGDVTYGDTLEKTTANISVLTAASKAISKIDNSYYLITTDPCIVRVNPIITHGQAQVNFGNFNYNQNLSHDSKFNVNVGNHPGFMFDNFANSSYDFIRTGEDISITTSRTGTPTFSTIAGYKGLKTNGSSNYINYNLSSSLSSFRLIFYFYKADSGSYNRVVGLKGPQYEIEVKGSSNTIYWGGDYSGGWKQNAWNKVEITKSGSTYSLYINGTFITSKSNSTALTGIVIGRGFDSGNFFNGYYKDIVIHDTSKGGAITVSLEEVPNDIERYENICDVILNGVETIDDPYIGISNILEIKDSDIITVEDNTLVIE